MEYEVNICNRTLWCRYLWYQVIFLFFLQGLNCVLLFLSKSGIKIEAPPLQFLGKDSSSKPQTREVKHKRRQTGETLFEVEVAMGNFFAHNEVEYIHNTDARMTWFAALEYCQREHGASLATIHSQAEQERIVQEFCRDGRDCWLGMVPIINIYDTSGWIWLDGTRVDFNGFAAGEPSGNFDMNPGATCVYTWTYFGNAWDDTTCFYEAMPLCEIRYNNNSFGVKIAFIIFLVFTICTLCCLILSCCSSSEKNEGDSSSDIENRYKNTSVT